MKSFIGGKAIIMAAYSPMFEAAGRHPPLA
jgi:hypothetical protein